VTLTVLVPESGDDIQAMKSGIMEITDIFIVNKADRHGVEAMVVNLQSMVGMRSQYSSLPWEQPVIKTVATLNHGIREVLDALERFKRMLQEHDNWQHVRNERMKNKVLELVNDSLSGSFWTPARKQLLRKELLDASEKQISPFHIAEKLIGSLRNT
ncbi:MAG: hypothetical protein JXR21_00710, partial [Candidatus Marinimicrobia bacterium]|nr:hypothetical protein [Candidatus Neomarinimicrobiota bacterium]